MFRCMLARSLEGQTGVAVGLEDLLDRVDVRGRAQIQSQVVLHGGLHDGTSRSLHGVVQAGVDNVLLGSTGNALLEGGRRRHRDLAADVTEAALQRLLDRF